MVRVGGELASRGISGIVISENECAGRGGVMVRVLQSGHDRSELQKLFDVKLRSVDECDRAGDNCSKRRALFVSEGM